MNRKHCEHRLMIMIYKAENRLAVLESSVKKNEGKREPCLREEGCEHFQYLSELIANNDTEICKVCFIKHFNHLKQIKWYILFITEFTNLYKPRRGRGCAGCPKERSSDQQWISGRRSQKNPWFWWWWFTNLKNHKISLINVDIIISCS